MGSFPALTSESRTLELVACLQDEDSSVQGRAWSELYRRYHDELLLVVRARLGARLRAHLESEDVLQSVALEAFRAMPRFEPRGEGSLRRFLHTLVVNKIRDRADTYGAQKRAGAVPLSDALLETVPSESPQPCAYYDDAYARLERALGRLPDEMREIVVLRRLEGLPSKEVAETLGKSDGAVRKLYSRALARLALELGAGAGGSPE